jgi:Zn-dependent peptidase ImmA (M78 family)
MNHASPAEKRAIAVIEEAGIDELPVPVEEIAISLGAEIVYDAYDGDVSGMLYRADGNALIGVNSKHAPTRQRFTVAHEIGHLVLHKGRPMFIDRFVRVNWRNGASDREEVQANAFAAELLMPRKFVESEVERVLSKRQNATPQQLAADLAKTFHVSAEAMSYRLENLGILDPYALVG